MLLHKSSNRKIKFSYHVWENTLSRFREFIGEKKFDAAMQSVWHQYDTGTMKMDFHEI